MNRLKCLYVCCVLLFAACGNDKNPITFPPKVETGNALEIYREGATLFGSVLNQDDADIVEYGILCSDHQSLDEASKLIVTDGELLNFSIPIRDLSPSKTYYYSAYATSGYSTIIGEVKTFSTTESNPPIFSNLQSGSCTENSFMVTTHIEDIGAHELLLCGFCYKELDASRKEPTIADYTVYVENLNVDYSTSIIGLSPNTTYLIRAFAGNETGVGYSKSIEVSTLEATKLFLSPAIAEVIESSEALITAKLWLPEGEILSEVGFCWSTESSIPTIEHNRYNLIEDMVDENLSYRIKGLIPGTIYYVRPYAICATHGVFYGDVCKIKTKEKELPNVDSENGSIDDLPTEIL